MEMIKRLVREEEGQGMVEYALIIALVGVMLIGALAALQGKIDTTFDEAGNAL